MRTAVGAGPLEGALTDAIRAHRCIFVAGLPAAGKSLVVQQLARIGSRLGRDVHLLQWDAARLPFDRADVLERYPEVEGVTHAAIRIAAGRWARKAVAEWDAAHLGKDALLVGETPLIGERFMELARPRDDAVEPLLGGERTIFLVPVPSPDVRRVIEKARAIEMRAPAHERDANSAPPHLVRSHWDEIERVASDLGVARSNAAGVYDPELYAAVYRAALRHRHVQVLRIDEVITLRSSAHAAPPGVREIVPSADEVSAAIADVRGLTDSELARAVARWYRV